MTNQEVNEMWDKILSISTLVIAGAFVAGCYLLQMDKWREKPKRTKGISRKGDIDGY